MRYIILIITALVLGAVIGPYVTNYSKQSAYSNDNIHSWACNKVYELRADNKEGCYDICLGIAIKDANVSEHNYLLLSNDHSAELINACAVVMSGAEW